MDVDRLTPTGELVLTALAEYRYLTAGQLLRLQVTRDKSHLYVTLRDFEIRDRSIVQYLDFGVLPGHGRLSRIYYLTAAGAALIESARPDLVPVSFPTRVHRFRNDYFHRINTVDIHIAVNRWAEQTDTNLRYFHPYYDDGIKRGNNTYRRTRVPVGDKAIIPDAIFWHTDQDDRLFVVEMCNGAEIQRVERKLLSYFNAFQKEAIEKAFDYPHAVRLLCLFQLERSLELMQERFHRHRQYTAFDDQIFLKSMDDLAPPFNKNWRRLYDEKVRTSLY